MDAGFTHHEGVEVTGDPATYSGMMSWIDEVRAGLERLDPEPALRECCHQATGDCGLAATTVCPRNNDTGDGYLHI